MIAQEAATKTIYDTLEERRKRALTKKLEMEKERIIKSQEGAKILQSSISREQFCKLKRQHRGKGSRPDVKSLLTSSLMRDDFTPNSFKENPIDISVTSSFEV